MSSESLNRMLPSESSYLCAKDLREGAEIALTCRGVMMEIFSDDSGDEDKPVLYFEGKKKGLPLNRSNMDVLSQAADDNPAAVAGLRAVLYRINVDLWGQMVPALRLRFPTQQLESDELPF